LKRVDLRSLSRLKDLVNGSFLDLLRLCRLVLELVAYIYNKTADELVDHFGPDSGRLEASEVDDDKSLAVVNIKIDQIPTIRAH
jgi:hypothetical protein